MVSVAWRLPFSYMTTLPCVPCIMVIGRFPALGLHLLVGLRGDRRRFAGGEHVQDHRVGHFHRGDHRVVARQVDILREAGRQARAGAGVDLHLALPGLDADLALVGVDVGLLAGARLDGGLGRAFTGGLAAGPRHREARIRGMSGRMAGPGFAARCGHGKDNAGGCPQAASSARIAALARRPSFLK
jgi:hypothetical protein